MSRKTLMLDDENSEWGICTKSVGYKHPKTGKYRIHPDKRDEFERCKKKVKKQLNSESIDEKKIINIIKREENPRMSKKELMEYVSNKTKKVVKKVYKDEVLKEASRDRFKQFDPDKWPDFNEPGIKKQLMRYLEALRLSGVINMYGSWPILCWTEDDLQRWLYGQGQDLESIQSRIDGDDDYYDDEDSEPDDKSIEKIHYKQIKYLLDNKQKIRDLLVRVALKRAERLDKDFDTNIIQRLFENAAKDAFMIFANFR